MDYLKQYIIQFQGLSEGNHDFEFNITDSFFEAFDSSDIEKGNIDVKISLDRETRMLVLNFFIEGYVEVQCDRCLDDFKQQLSGTEVLIIKFGKEDEKQDDNIVFLSETAYEIDISSHLYDYINLMLPFRKIHSDGKCNSEIINKLEEMSEKSSTDERWDALKNIKF